MIGPGVVGLAISLAVAGLIAFPLLTPWSRMPVHRLFAIALGNPAERKAWDALYQKLRILIVGDFRDACIALNKHTAVLPPAELFEYLRNRALAENPEFGGETDVERFVHTHMRELALHV